MKKVLLFSLCIMSIFFLTACGKKMIHVEGSLEDLMKDVYKDVKEEELPRGINNTLLTEENEKGFIGEAKIDYEEAIASESQMSSVAHSVILIRMKEDVTEEEIEEAKTELKEKVDPRKWVCVGVEEVHVESNGDLILVVLNDTHYETMISNFKKLK